MTEQWFCDSGSWILERMQDAGVMDRDGQEASERRENKESQVVLCFVFLYF